MGAAVLPQLGRNLFHSGNFFRKTTILWKVDAAAAQKKLDNNSLRLQVSDLSRQFVAPPSTEKAPFSHARLHYIIASDK